MTELHYTSTRDKNNRVTASQAILKGIAEDGGLYVSTTMPQLSLNWETLQHQSYQEIALPILKEFLTDFSYEELQHCIHSAYNTTFDDTTIAQFAYDKYQQETKNNTPTVIVSTASPYKFPQSVVSAVKESNVTTLSDQQLIDEVRQ